MSKCVSPSRDNARPHCVAIQQPEHAPWLGFFHKMLQVDTYVYLDVVQFKKRYFENRNKIRTAEGWCWITVPVLVKGRYAQQIREVEIAPDDGWKRSYAGRLRSSYGKTGGCPDLLGWLVESWLQESDGLLIDMNLTLIEHLCFLLGITTPVRMASDLVGEEFKGSELILEICRKTEADRYLSGPDGRNYLDLEAFAKAGVDVEFHDFNHPQYSQVHPGNFLSHMSVIDVLFNLGSESTRKMLQEVV